tara:strand:- start:2327 stop:2959 length:633 start_codon:yes stop_codon:yes gene_type:complete
MFKYLYILSFIAIFLSNTSSKAEISFKPLFDQSEKLFAKKILEVMPSLNTMKLGNQYSENIIVEFIDYNCGYCKAIHSELISLAEKENLDLVIYFYQFPILSESSRKYAKTLLAIADTDKEKALKVHNDLMSISGSLNENKFNNILIDNDINIDSLQLLMNNIKFDEMLEVTYYLAKRIGGNGTPLLIINNFVEQGYLKEQEILKIIDNY